MSLFSYHICVVGVCTCKCKILKMEYELHSDDVIAYNSAK